jgi:succinate dehydrogenase/fumarate reductase-like Fe-S protein
MISLACPVFHANHLKWTFKSFKIVKDLVIDSDLIFKTLATKTKLFGS